MECRGLFDYTAARIVTVRRISGCKPSVFTLVVFGLVTAVAMALDYIVPALGTKKFKCSKWETWGCVIGTLLGVFLFPIGLLLGPFLGAFVGEP